MKYQNLILNTDFDVNVGNELMRKNCAVLPNCLVKMDTF
jgi:hypothetical protein